MSFVGKSERPRDRVIHDQCPVSSQTGHWELMIGSAIAIDALQKTD